MMRKPVGGWIALAGAAVLTAIVVGTHIYAGAGGSGCGLRSVEKASSTAVVYSPLSKLQLNHKFCVGVRTDLYFAPELEELKKREGALQAAIGREKAIQEERVDPPAKGASDADVKRHADGLAAARTDLQDAQARRVEAQTRLEALPKKKPVTLFIDGRASPLTFELPVKGRETWWFVDEPLSMPTDANTDQARAWRAALTALGRDGSAKVVISLGDEGRPRPNATIGEVTFQVFNGWLVLLGAGALLLMMGGVIAWGWETALLRDRPAIAQPLPGEPSPDKPPFSLGRVQLAWWFMLTLGGFLYIWVVTGQSIGVLTTAVVTLLGISGASSGAAVAIDAADPSVRENPKQSNGFFRDILGDDSGIVLHRVQMLTWTLVLGLMMIGSVVWGYSFPAFDNALLILAGVVSGVYVAAKVPEKVDAPPGGGLPGGGGALPAPAPAPAPAPGPAPAPAVPALPPRPTP